MITARHVEKYAPAGQSVVKLHPGRPIRKSNREKSQLISAMRDVSIHELRTLRKPFWKLRPGQMFTEELYVAESTLIQSKLGHDNGKSLYKSFTVDSPVIDAFWINLPNLTKFNSPDLCDEKTNGVDPHSYEGIGILDADHTVNFFWNDGKEHIANIPFVVHKLWPTEKGIIFERDLMKKQGKNCSTASSLPILFSLTHPEGEVSPVIIRTGHPHSRLFYLTNPSVKIVYADSSMCLTYDRDASVHSAWSLRLAHPEEIEAFKEGGFEFEAPTAPHTVSSHSAHLTNSSQSPCGSPFRSFSISSTLASPGGSLLNATSRTTSPSISRLLGMSSVSGSPSACMYRLDSSSPSTKNQHSAPRCFVDHSLPDPLQPPQPEITLELIWTEMLTGSADKVVGQASKCFLTTDLCGQSYLLYLVSYRSQAHLIKLEKSNDLSQQMIFGAASTFPARDVCLLKDLCMFLVLNPQSQLILYSGMVQIKQIFVPGLPSLSVHSHFNNAVRSSLPRPSTPFDSPTTFGNVSSNHLSSTAPQFEDDMQLLSPVPSDNDSLLLDTSLVDEVSFHSSLATLDKLHSLHENSFILEYTDSVCFKSSLPSLAKTALVKECLNSLRNGLPRDLAMLCLQRWYAWQGSPGSENGLSEWLRFCQCLFSMMGYDPASVVPCLMQDTSPGEKKQRPSTGQDTDWSYLLGSQHHRLVQSSPYAISSLPSCISPCGNSASLAPPDTLAPLFLNSPSVLLALHLCYEELKLDTLFVNQLGQLAALLLHIARNLDLFAYTNMYIRENPQLSVSNIPEPLWSARIKASINYPSHFYHSPPSLHFWLMSYLQQSPVQPFPVLSLTSNRILTVISLVSSMFEGLTPDEAQAKYCRLLCSWPQRLSSSRRSSFFMNRFSYPNTPDAFANAIVSLNDINLAERFVFGVRVFIEECCKQARRNPPPNLHPSLLKLCGRQDLAKLQDSMKVENRRMAAPKSASAGGSDGLEYIDTESLRMRFPNDLRIEELRRLLQTSQPVRICLTQSRGVSDHDFIEEQERHLYSTCIRTMALPVGRGMVTMSSYWPVSTEPIEIPNLCLTGKAYPGNNTVDLSHIDTPSNMSAWPSFHNGVAAGLRIASSAKVMSAWVLQGKRTHNELTAEHAGWLLGLGMNGHLEGLTRFHQYDYLVEAHDMTSIAILLALAANKRGTADVNVTKVLSLHIPALLPPTSTELDLHHSVQVASVLGIGLLYLESNHRHFAEVLLWQIARPPGLDTEYCTDRESYSLAAGLALGMVLLGKEGGGAALADLNILHHLYNFMVGGQTKLPSDAVKENCRSIPNAQKVPDILNVNVTCPGATVALGLMFLQSGNEAVSQWLRPPTTQYLLDQVRPDLLMLMTLSHGLVNWHEIVPTKEWLTSNLPKIVADNAFELTDPELDGSSLSQAFCNIQAGACMALAFRFAGSGNQQAFQLLLTVAKQAVTLQSQANFVSRAGRTAVETYLSVCTMALSIVMAGTGNLEVFRLCRMLHSRVGAAHCHIIYGSHMVVGMALGLLFLGAGRLTLSNSLQSIPILLTAFFPKLPLHSSDNRYHLQALRHLYVLVSEPRVLLPREVSSNQPVYLPLQIFLKDTNHYKKSSYKVLAPCPLPDLDSIEKICLVGDRYWPITFTSENMHLLKKILEGSGSLFVKQKIGRLSYKEDPKGFRGSRARYSSSAIAVGKTLETDDVESMSSDAVLVLIAKHFCSGSNNPFEFHKLSLPMRALHECVCQDKAEELISHLCLHQLLRDLSLRHSPLLASQLRLILLFYERISLDNSVLSPTILTAAAQHVSNLLSKVLKDHETVLCNYLEGKILPTENLALFSCYLNWHSFPNSISLSPNFGYPNIGSLHRHLCSKGVKGETSLEICKLWQRNISRKKNTTLRN